MPTNQYTLYKKIAAYLTDTGGATEHSIAEGFCSGITGLWLAAVAADNLAFFNDLCNQIENYSTDNTGSLAQNKQIEAVLSAIIITQQNIYYLENARQQDLAQSLDLIKPPDKLAILQEEFHLINTYNITELAAILSALPPNALIRISNFKHTIGITRDTHGFSLFDPNVALSGENIDNAASTATAIFAAFNKRVNTELAINIAGYSTGDLQLQYALPHEIVNKTYANNPQLLLLAIAAGDEDMVQKLVNEHQGMANADQAPISTAIVLYQHRIMQLLLDHGAPLDVQCSDSNTTLLQAAILQDKLGYYNHAPTDLGYITLSMLLDHGADPNFANSFDLTPADLALHHGKLQKLALLLAYGAKLSDSNILTLQQHVNTPKIWRLIKDIKLIRSSMGKNSHVSKELYKLANYPLHLDNSTDPVKDTIEFLECINKLKKHGLKTSQINIIVDGTTINGAPALAKINSIMADWAHNQDIDLVQAQRLYELSKPLTNWWQCGYTTEAYANLKEIIARIDPFVDHANPNHLKQNPALAKHLLAILDSLNHFAHIISTNGDAHKFKHLALATQKQILHKLATMLALKSTQEVVPTLKKFSTTYARAKTLTFTTNTQLDTIILPASSQVAARLCSKTGKSD